MTEDEQQSALDRRLLLKALDVARTSHDPATKVGSVITRRNTVVGIGVNQFAEGVAYTTERLTDRDTKLKLTVHAEMDAVLMASRHGVSVNGCTLYLACTDDSSAIWGGPPCTRCCVELIHAGIKRIVSLPQKTGPSKWHDDLNFARGILKEADVELVEISQHRN